MTNFTTVATELFVVIAFALLNLQIQIRLIVGIWARGCTWKQALDIYDLGKKYKNWLFFDIAANFVILFVSAALMGSLNGLLGLSMSYIVLSLFGIEAFAFVCFPIRLFATKIAMQNNPNLLDFNGKYRGTCEEYKKLLLLLDEKNLKAYKSSASTLWAELLLLNKRRKEAYARKAELGEIKADVQKLITDYTVENNVEKRLKAQERLNQILKQEADIDEFTLQVEEQIQRSENIFMDMRTKLAVGQLDNVLPDLTSYTSKVKALEYTVEKLD